MNIILSFRVFFITLFLVFIMIKKILYYINDIFIDLLLSLYTMNALFKLLKWL